VVLRYHYQSLQSPNAVEPQVDCEPRCIFSASEKMAELVSA
jgi:hypothetical protein